MSDLPDAVPLPGVEIESVAELDQALRAGVSPSRLRLQDLDLRDYHGFDGRTDVDEMVVLGGQLSADLDAHLRAHGAIVFPNDPEAAPIHPYRNALYTADELYAGLEHGYAATPDARAFTWYRQHRQSPDVYAALLQAIHDDSVSDALAEFIDGLPVVGVMGGHAVARGTEQYAAAARLGRSLAERGYLVVTGGGPGAMEAVNLGAAARDSRSLDQALGELGRVPDFAPDIGAWARCGFVARTIAGADATEAPARSLGIPTWFYGHEPPNVFAQRIAKYFSNPLREDGLLASSAAGVIVLPGAAGTVQEIFQVATRLYYADTASPPLILIGRDQWTAYLPAWPLLQALGRDRAMSTRVHLVDDPDEAIGLLDAVRSRR